MQVDTRSSSLSRWRVTADLSVSLVLVVAAPRRGRVTGKRQRTGV